VRALISELGSKRELALVFVRTKHGADRLVKRLRAHDVEAVALHGNKSQRQRAQALSRFESGEVDILIATDIAARGIHVDGISHVINFDPPADSETYVHRIGRTGRAGRTGIGITLLSPEQRHDVRKLAGHLGLEHGLDRASRHRRPSRRHNLTRG
jgi:superfamily II DNA/RNA helicase